MVRDAVEAVRGMLAREREPTGEVTFSDGELKHLTLVLVAALLHVTEDPLPSDTEVQELRTELRRVPSEEFVRVRSSASTTTIEVERASKRVKAALMGLAVTVVGLASALVQQAA